MKIGALSPWLGSKRTMAPLIIEQAGPHVAWLEPFCGSCSVLLAKEPSSQETVCDLHGDLTNLASVLREEKMAVSLYARLQSTLLSEELYLEARDSCRKDYASDEADVDRAYYYFFAAWLGRNGVAGSKRGNCQIAARWTNNGGSPTIRFQSAIDSIPYWHARLRNVLILKRDSFKVLESIEDDKGTAIYCDPPYLVNTRTGKDAAGQYLYDFTAQDHLRLAELLCRFKRSRVVVSYYHDPLLARLYPGWEQLDCTRVKHLSVQGRRGSEKQQAPEVLLVNGSLNASLHGKAISPDQLFDAVR